MWAGDEKKLTRIEFTGDPTDQDGDLLGDITITLEVNIG